MLLEFHESAEPHTVTCDLVVTAEIETRLSLSLFSRHVELSELEKIVRRRHREIPARRPSRGSQIL